MIRRLDVKILTAVLFTVLLPLGFSVLLVKKLVDTSLQLGLNEEIAGQLQRGLDLHRARIQEIKQEIAQGFVDLADSHALAAAAETEDPEVLQDALRALVERHFRLRKVTLEDKTGGFLEAVPVASEPRRQELTVTKSTDVSWGPYIRLEATYGVEERLLTEYKTAGDQYETYKALAGSPTKYLANRFVWVYLALLTISFVVSVLVGLLWARRLARRIHRLGQATSVVASGDLSVRVDPGADDEVGRLVESFNSMLTELSDNRARIEYLQKISAWQEMARRLAHEIKNPLTPIQLAAQELRRKYCGGDPAFERLLAQSTEIIEEEVETLHRLTAAFSSFAKLPEIRPEPTDIATFLDDCEASLGPVAEQQGVRLVFEAPRGQVLVGLDATMMKRVVDNLVRNAIEALRGANVKDPLVRIRALYRSSRKYSELELRVEDNGPGVPRSSEPVIFDPYFTTKESGTGLGLAISKKIVLEHGGTLKLDERYATGAAFSVVLPYVQSIVTHGKQGVEKRHG
ncbi:MAG: ATP-binding protein [Myxococcota bacterium]|jgi:nitrogen fixation/metabolism regulation signal transduction histidine kinase|nr:ATP-binding protein [Myxococcota bacterium]